MLAITLLADRLLARPLLPAGLRWLMLSAGPLLAAGLWLHLGRAAGPLMSLALAVPLPTFAPSIPLLLVRSLLLLPPIDSRPLGALRELSLFGPRLFGTRLFNSWLLRTGLLRTGLFDALFEPWPLRASLLLALFGPRRLLMLLGARGAALGPCFAILRQYRNRNPD